MRPGGDLALGVHVGHDVGGGGHCAPDPELDADLGGADDQHPDEHGFGADDVAEASAANTRWCFLSGR